MRTLNGKRVVLSEGEPYIYLALTASDSESTLDHPDLLKTENSYEREQPDVDIPACES